MDNNRSLEFIDLNKEERANFFEYMSLILVGLKNAFGVYCDKEKFNNLLIIKADEFICNDRDIITDEESIRKILKNPLEARIALIKEPDINEPWKYEDKVRNVRFGLALGVRPWDEKSNFYPIEFGFPKDTIANMEDEEFNIDERDIGTYIKAIIPEPHSLVRACLKQVLLGRDFYSNNN